MKKINNARQSSQAKKTWYVYALVRPDTDEIFYIGKGSVHVGGVDRIDNHEEEARKGVRSRKCDIIRELWARGIQVQKWKLYETDSEADALQYERTLITFMNANGKLTNIRNGATYNREYRNQEEETRAGRTGKRRAEQWLSANQAGNLLGVRGQTVIRMVEKREITGYRVGNVWRFKRSDIAAYLEAHRYGPGQQPDDD
jgi:excisionase family DNA binding protein